MGMYDEVAMKCPECGRMVIEQSKGGECLLKMYSLEDCPEEVLRGLDDIFYCAGCKTKLKLLLKKL